MSVIRALSFICSVFCLSMFLHCGGGYRLTGKVQDTAFNPLNSARITVIYGRTPDSLTSLSDANGQFTIKGIKAKKVTVKVFAPKFIPIEKSLVFRSSTLEEQFTLSPKLPGIVGRVIDSKTHEPIPNARVRIQEENFQQLTDLNGKFKITGEFLNPGIAYTIEISKENYVPAIRIVRVKEAENFSMGDIALVQMTAPAPIKENLGESKTIKSVGDIEATQVVGQVTIDATVENFLLKNEKFTFLQFKRLFGKNLSDEIIRENLQTLIQQKKVEKIDEDNFKSLEFEKKYQFPKKPEMQE